ncbi:putative pyruvate, phosphate dikinase regulatory protein [Companilactobacillus sp. RD055328]|uniref:pyruvate, water dikinase regulatory protein n=1 Tax=Companilactobacillus sp. RD055328 TaxID=2916634 RepID=UPI001FC83202|nr:pyruvate, water dikinase regulatory protein [Companilactobacillus sp. RD055328]GKQ42655.1 putative pyruvate, phosphate dikinase regulatory protein [Companilactobacillus sp. RD055328]
MKKKQSIYIISDSAGDTAFSTTKAAISQFSDLDVTYHRQSFMTDASKIKSVLETIREDTDPILFFTIVSPDNTKLIIDFCKENNIAYHDILNPMISVIEQTTQITPNYEAGAVHQLDTGYFDMISAVEFALVNDDGKRPTGFLEADIVLLGVSRTSKTPLALFLANNNIKVANLPLVPKAEVPEELWQVDPKKIVGLTTDLNVLRKIRRQRMIAYGLNPDTTYSDEQELIDELEFSKKLYEKIGCLVINTADRSIEETASIITEKLDLGHYKTIV